MRRAEKLVGAYTTLSRAPCSGFMVIARTTGCCSRPRSWQAPVCHRGIFKSARSLNIQVRSSDEVSSDYTIFRFDRLISSTNYACAGRSAYEALCTARNGLRTVNAIIAAMAFIIAPITNTMCQPPLRLISTLPSGISNDAVPFAV